MNAYFSTPDEGGWEDLSAAGCKYLLLIELYSPTLDAVLQESHNSIISPLGVCIIWADLLANAFRTSSTKPPDSLPSVKKWKAFAKEIELLKRALAKKDGDKVFTAYKSAEEKLDDYLDAVELPSGMELKQM